MFNIIANGTVIGRTAFEHGDAPMGVAFGAFLPVEDFAEFRATTPMTRQDDGGVCVWSNLVAMSAEGIALDGATVTVFVFGPELSEEMEVTAEGIPSPLYERVFAHHVQDYEARFSPES